jgi:hypothetical protein
MKPHRHVAKTATALALAIGVIAPASASARFDQYRIYLRPPATAQTASTSVSGSAFDWADAGIGAAVGVALSALGVGSGRVVTRRRRMAGSPAATN